MLKGWFSFLFAYTLGLYIAQKVIEIGRISVVMYDSDQFLQQILQFTDSGIRVLLKCIIYGLFSKCHILAMGRYYICVLFGQLQLVIFSNCFPSYLLRIFIP